MMRRFLAVRGGVVAIVAYGFAVAGSAGLEAQSDEGSAELADKIRQTDLLFAEWDRPDSPGCAVGVIQDGSLLFTRGYGSANLDYQTPLDASSVFYIASTSKQFTAAAIARLALDGRLSLDDEIQEHVPEIPRYEWPVRIRHLVHHTSGLRDYLALMSLAGQSYEDFWDNESGIDLLERQRSLNFEPGSEYLYSNSGYILMAEIVERVTGQTLQEYSREQFFAPLEMSATHWGEDYAAVVPNRVVSYDARSDGTYRGWLKNFHGKGDGNLLTSIEDLAQWDRIFYQGSEPWTSLTDLSLRRGTLNDGEEQSYAFGLVHGEYRGLATVAHGGGMLGFRTQFLRFPDERFSVICLCNLGSINPGRLSNQLADIWLFERDPPADDAESRTPPGRADSDDGWTPSEADLERFVGSYYSIELDVTYSIELREGQLYAVRPRDSGRLTPVEPDVFSAGFTTAEFASGDGPAAHFTLGAGRVRGLRFERR